MTEVPQKQPASPHATVDSGRLWAGGLATALVAALIAVAGILFARGLFGVPVLAPKGDGVWGDASTAWYAFGAAVASVLATGLMQILLASTPRPRRFFAWVVALVCFVAVVAPFMSDATTAAKMTTGCLNLVLGVAIGTLISGVAASASRMVAVSTTAPGPYPPPAH